VWCDKGGCDGGRGDGYPGECSAECAPARSTTPARGEGGDAVRRAHDHGPDGGTYAEQEAGQWSPGLRQDQEFALECLAGPPEQRLDRSDFDPLVISDLLVRPAAILAQRQHMAMAHRKAVECPVGQLPVIGSDDHLLRRRSTGHAHWRARAELQVLRWSVPRTPPQHVGAYVSGDDRQPRVETPLPGKIGQGFPGPREGFLRGVFGLVPIVQPAHAEAQQAFVVASVKSPERARVTGLAALHQNPVAIQVDVVAQPCELSLS
jgi:hypothetical protein